MLKGVNGTVENEGREQKGEFLNMSLGTLGASLLGIILAGKGINRTDERVIRVSCGDKKKTDCNAALSFN